MLAAEKLICYLTDGDDFACTLLDAVPFKSTSMVSGHWQG